MSARTSARFAGLVAALAMTASGLAVAAPAEARPSWTEPRGVAPRGVAVDFPARVAVGEGGRTLLVFSCDRGTPRSPDWVRCARWRERSGTLRPLLTLAAEPDRWEDAVLEAVVSSRGVGTIVWSSARGIDVRRVSPSGRVGGGRLLTTERTDDLSATAGTDGTVAVGWHSASEGAQLRVVRPGGALQPVRTLPGTHVHAISPAPAGGYAVLTTTGTEVPAQYGGTDTVHSGLTLSLVDPRGVVRSSARVAGAGQGDVAVLGGGTTVVAWWRPLGDRSVLVERRYAGAADGRATTRQLLSSRRSGGAADLVVAPGGRVYLGWGSGVALLPRQQDGALRRTRVVGTSFPTSLHAARGRVVVLSATRSEAGKWLDVWTWDGAGPTSPRRRLLADDADYSPFENPTQFEVASGGGHVAVLNVTGSSSGWGEVVYRD
ncbi:hypothetical protein [Nocardioides abyssi]|uniref:Secreted protein n=1 Tax=Nocardioides abyssi TaxID=3058370 RepID=A0ABT8EZ88_9ACTN|nr:hypothetical protein [Nocardioides abyssi]MDN4163497.1 hypothetical protein [Nocardioides abyssi]